MDTVIDLFAKEEKFKDIDFLFPALTEDRTGFIPRPASNAQIMDIIRDELCKLIPPDTIWDVTDKSGHVAPMNAHQAIKLFTFSSCRVFIPEWSNVADIPRELRRWLGRWREDSMADSYTRKVNHLINLQGFKRFRWKVEFHRLPDLKKHNSIMIFLVPLCLGGRAVCLCFWFF